MSGCGCDGGVLQTHNAAAVTQEHYGLTTLPHHPISNMGSLLLWCPQIWKHRFLPHCRTSHSILCRGCSGERCYKQGYLLPSPVAHSVRCPYGDAPAPAQLTGLLAQLWCESDPAQCCHRGLTCLAGPGGSPPLPPAWPSSAPSPWPHCGSASAAVPTWRSSSCQDGGLGSPKMPRFPTPLGSLH